MTVLHVSKCDIGTQVVIELFERPRNDEASPQIVENGHPKWGRFKAMANRLQKETKGVVGTFERADLRYFIGASLQVQLSNRI